MLIPSVRFDLPFTCVNETGAPTAPTGLPTGVLVKNGADTATPVVVTMTGAQGIAACTIPGDAVAADRFYIRVSAVISGVAYVVSGPSDAVESPQTLTALYDAAKTAAQPGAAMALTALERTAVAGTIEAEFLNDLTGGAFLAGLQTQIQALFDQGADVPVAVIAATVATAVRTNLNDKLALIDAAVSSRLAALSYTAPPSVAGLATSAEIDEVLTAIESVPTADENAAEILLNPANRLATNANGYVTSTNGGGGGGGATLVVPIVTTAPNRLASLPVEIFTDEAMPITLTVKDSAGAAVDLTGIDLTLFMVRPPASVRTLADLREFEKTVKDAIDFEEGDSVAGLSGNAQGQVTLAAVPDFAALQAGPVPFALRRTSNEEVIARGVFLVHFAP